MDAEQLSILKEVFTESQWSALIFTIAATMSLTKVFKHVYFGFNPERRLGRKSAILWLAAFTFGILASVVGSIIGIPHQPDWFWVLSGTVSGIASIAVFKVVVEVAWPRIKGQKNAK